MKYELPFSNRSRIVIFCGSALTLILLLIPAIWLQACEDFSPGKKKCEKNHTGDRVFKNESKDIYRVEVDGNEDDALILNPGESSTVFDLKIDDIHQYKSGPGPMWTMTPTTKQFKVAECSSDTEIIK